MDITISDKDKLNENIIAIKVKTNEINPITSKPNFRLLPCTILHINVYAYDYVNVHDFLLLELFQLI